MRRGKIYEKIVNIPSTLLKCDNLSGIIPDRLSCCFWGERKNFLTFHRVEAVNCKTNLRGVKKTAAVFRYMLFRERKRGNAEQYLFESAGG